jgi:hypothetical protein
MLNVTERTSCALAAGFQQLSSFGIIASWWLFVGTSQFFHPAKLVDMGNLHGIHTVGVLK